jgi:uncharacterized protein (TIGR02145 family)
MRNIYKFVCLFVFLLLVKTSFSQWNCGDVFIDNRNGQSYPTVQIGEQCWMAKNLNIGVMLVGSDMSSDNGIIEKYCWGDFDDNCEIYGGLYMWDEMMNYVNSEHAQGICPNGWYIPSDGEVKTLEIALGMEPSIADLSNTWRGTNEGTQIKIGGSSGFNALLSGARTGPSSFMLLNSYEFFYTSTESGSSAWRRCVRDDASNIGRFNTYPKSYALSVRCILNYQTVDVNSMNRNILASTINFSSESQVLTINFNHIPQENIQISLYDMQGRKVLQETVFANTQTLQIQVQNYCSGIYVVSLAYNNNFISKKISITH